MTHEPTSTVRARRLRDRRARGVVMVVPVEVGEGGVALLVGDGLLKRRQASDRNAVGAACLAALEQWAGRPGARFDGWIRSTVDPVVWNGEAVEEETMALTDRLRLLSGAKLTLI